MERMDIDSLKNVQHFMEKRDVHIVDFDEEGFTIAHTDAERAEAEGGGAPLDECPLHNALLEDDGYSVPKPGIYAARPTSHTHDPTSESFRSDALGWDFEPLVIPREV